MNIRIEKYLNLIYILYVSVRELYSKLNYVINYVLS